MSIQHKCVLCFSGGLDSTVLLYQLRRMDMDVHCLSVHYGQRHEVELERAAKISAYLNLDENHHQYADLSKVRRLLAASSQTSREIDVPEGYYTDETMKATVVPNRNMILLSLATAWGITLKAHHVAYAAHAGDHAIYPDCRKDFVVAMHQAIGLCDYKSPKLITPFVYMTKADIVKLGVELRVPFDMTYSCYKGGIKHCGRCGTCAERKEAFQLAGISDPTEYEA